MPHATKKSEAPKSEGSRSEIRMNDMSRRTCELVRRLLKEPRFSGWGGQARLGEALGVTAARISKLAGNGGGVSVEFARRVADLAGIDVGALVPAETIPPPRKNTPMPAARTVPAMPAVHRLHNLELAVAYHKDENRWSDATIAAARVYDGEDYAPQRWAKVLDKLEKAITAAFGDN